MIVIDALSLAKYVLREAGWHGIEAVLVLGPYSVDSVLKEVFNAIWKHCLVFRRIYRGAAFKLLEMLFMLIKEKVITLEHQVNTL